MQQARTPGETLRWDIFCDVIDNYGDIGVCWRLAADLGARGHMVRLWVNDASALQWMAPSGAPGVQVLPWPAPGAEPPAEHSLTHSAVVIEAFGCAIPEFFQQQIASNPNVDGRLPLWINLEYLSAESYVERCHRLPSPISSGPARGLTRWFFYPGFTPATGGLLREADLTARQAAFDRPAWRQRHGIDNDHLAVSLFCYEPQALPQLLAQLHARADAQLLVTPGRASAAVKQKIALNPLWNQCEQLWISYPKPCSQTAFDELLWGCDLNLVRGEDSLVRALWAGQPLVWQIYPQQDDAHHAKLHAFLDWLQAPDSLRRFHLAWNGVGAATELPMLDAATLHSWRHCIQAARQRLLEQADLVTQLLGFFREKS